jgi:glucose-1-phosphate adenylyltransferase
MLRDVLTVVLAGGKGTRLEPLTRDRAKPAVPFGGQYRIVDFALSNCVNSGLRRVRVLTQFKSHSLDRHVRSGWSFLSPELGESVDLLPPQQRIDEHWYRGTADAIYQNIYSLERERAKDLLVLAGDHIYTMDYGKMIDEHRANNAEATIGCIPVPVTESNQFGIMSTSEDGRVTAFREKPETCNELPNDPGYALGSMGIYVFSLRTLFDRLCDDAARTDSSHDFGRDVIPAMLESGSRVFAHRFTPNDPSMTRPYWRDVGTLDAYYEANLDLVAAKPQLNLYDPTWPVRTHLPPYPPPKFVHGEEGPPGQARRGEAIDSLVCPGGIISGGRVRASVLSPNVRVNSYSVVEESILFDGVEIGRHCRVRKAIIDKDAKLPPHTVLGYDADADRRRGFTVTAGGIVVVPKAHPPEAFAL